MVGFFRQPSKKKEESAANQPKFKNSNSPENLRFDFEDFSSQFGGFSVASVNSFTDFDSIKDWIEEMQSPGKAETGNGVDNLIGNNSLDIVQGMNGEQKIVYSKACSSSDECMDSKDGLGGDNCEAKLDGLKECGTDGFVVITKLGSCQVAEINADNLQGDTKGSHGNWSEGELGENKCCKIESLNCSIEEGLEKVTLVGDEKGLDQIDNGMKKVSTTVVDVDNDSDSDNDNETSSASSSTSSSSSESDDDDDEEEEEEEEEEDVNEKEKLRSCKGMDTGPSADMEEGQIVDSDADNMVSWSDENDEDGSVQNSEEFQFDDEDDDTVKGPIKSKNELEVLPPVPPVTVTLQPCHQILPVGVISSVLGAQVIVEGSEMHNPLSEGSILWISESRVPLGLVDEIFGPVKTPYYIVRYNSESEVPSGIQNGTLVGFVAEFVGHVLNDKNLYQKGYDASGENDEEVFDEDDFSDDEKEAEYKRMLKMSKRGNNNQGKGPKNKKKNNRSQNKIWTKDEHSTFQSPRDQSSKPMQQRTGSPVLSASEGNRFGPPPTRPFYSGGPAVPNLSQGYQLGPPMGQNFPGGPATIPQQVQQAGFLLNGLLGNGIGFQQQNMAMSSGIPMNGMPWMQQNHAQNLQVPTPWLQQQHVSYSQMPVMNPPLCQQPFDLSQLVGAAATSFGPANFSARPTNGPWVGMLGQNFPIQALLSLGVPGQSSQLPMSPATLSNAQQGQSCNSQPQNSLCRNEEVSSQFNQGSSSGRGGRGRGRGRGRKPFHRRGGHFGGGRGRQQP